MGATTCRYDVVKVDVGAYCDRKQLADPGNDFNKMRLSRLRRLLSLQIENGILA